MRLALIREGDNIRTIKEYTDIDSRGEIGHMLAELEIIKIELLALWQEYGEDD